MLNYGTARENEKFLENHGTRLAELLKFIDSWEKEEKDFVSRQPRHVRELH